MKYREENGDVLRGEENLVIGTWYSDKVILISHDDFAEIMKEANERSKMRDRLDDLLDGHRTVMEEKCSMNEVHCTCVPALRVDNARLREELTDAKSSIVAFLADFEKWQDCIVDEDGVIHDLGVLRGALAGEVKE